MRRTGRPVKKTVYSTGVLSAPVKSDGSPQTSRRLELTRDEILSAYHASGKEKDIRGFTKLLIQRSPLFKALRLLDYPRLVGLVRNVVTVCLKEQGLLI